MEQPRIAPRPADQWSHDIDPRTLLAADGQPLHIFGTLAHHPKLLKRWLVFASHILAKSSLGFRHRELAILRVGVRCRSVYEWGQHVAIARAGSAASHREGALPDAFSDHDIDAVVRGPDDPHWSAVEAAILRAVDELHDSAAVSDATWAELARRFDTEQLLDLVMTIGQYHTVSYLLNATGVQLDDGVPDESARWTSALA